MITKENIEIFQQIETPFYFYDVPLLERTLDKIVYAEEKYGYNIHYALKANSQSRIIKMMASRGLGADCVSGNEILAAVKNGIDPKKIVYAGVGKTDREIKIALENGIFCFNCESIPELLIINEIAASMNLTASVAFRVNPDVDAKTHIYITTGREENKFGMSPWMFDDLINVYRQCKNVKFIGLHFHIGSQITDMDVFKTLCTKAMLIEEYFSSCGLLSEIINLGGGLGVDYISPEENPIPCFDEYFKTIKDNLDLRPNQKVHFELGRSVVAQCGYLISRVVFVKKGRNITFVILDAGMNDLIRPALYGAKHVIRNLSSYSEQKVKYDVVGPVCESSDTWGKGILLPDTKRGDFMAMCSAGAYGQTMAMRYNLRKIASDVYSDDKIFNI